ncbi:MAG TPA: GNAT family N-acetyltransferase, partial [Thermomicrobiales bacterium]|nr:GNAT family N-acetyltransferase [Thermomicrobiales bacterium]
MTEHQPATDEPTIQFETKAVPEQEDAAAAIILAPATGAGTAKAALAKIIELRAEEKAGFYGGYINGELIGAYGMRRDGMANTIAIIAVREDFRRKGIGRALLTDALYRSARRPLTAETDDEGLAFYKACGFKLVGRRV